MSSKTYSSEDAKIFEEYGLPRDVPHIPGTTEPQLCVLDAFRTSIARRIVEVFPELTIEKVGREKQPWNMLSHSYHLPQVYDGVDYGKKGADFTVALPRFKLKGKPDELTKKFTEVVRCCFYCSYLSLIRAHSPTRLVQPGYLDRVGNSYATVLTFPSQYVHSQSPSTKSS